MLASPQQMFSKMLLLLNLLLQIVNLLLLLLLLQVLLLSLMWVRHGSRAVDVLSLYLISVPPNHPTKQYSWFTGKSRRGRRWHSACHCWFFFLWRRCLSSVLSLTCFWPASVSPSPSGEEVGGEGTVECVGCNDSRSFLICFCRY